MEEVLKGLIEQQKAIAMQMEEQNQRIEEQQRIPDNQKVDLASMYLQGKDGVCYSSYSLARKNIVATRGSHSAISKHPPRAATGTLYEEVIYRFLSFAGLWLKAMGCSLLVSMASLICLTIIPVLCAHGNPSKGVVDALALFGAGAMLGDAFLHQLPHAFSRRHSRSHDHHDHSEHSHSHSHSHSLEDLSIGLSVLCVNCIEATDDTWAFQNMHVEVKHIMYFLLYFFSVAAGIVVFLVVEKIVRFVEEISGGENSWAHAYHHHHHHHHHHKTSKKLKDDDGTHDKSPTQPSKDADANTSSNSKPVTGPKSQVRKRNAKVSSSDGDSDVDAAKGKTGEEKTASQPSNLVFGYLNLFSDGVHNFTDGMALGSAFLLHGSVGGWSRTLFLLAHELPQEVGDFGILVRSGFSVSKALFFNFLSALVALAGTALALLLGKDPGQSSLIEGFTAGGFIYISVAGVLAEMNNNGSTSLRSGVTQLASLLLGMGIALYISLVE
ncbi:hypothetical protein Cgig2_016499 [Carnegiea gigantea]|uniref:Uncharacterized protein n=1 Tax=Carnegiea gigantea TaxID=171969 RepID=A0A9Q1GY81_9CARY|nr:hypothetical protein Cgig2_016499 [Carnegiea gigantea]